jgi:hypothetical protein
MYFIEWKYSYNVPHQTIFIFSYTIDWRQPNTAHFMRVISAFPTVSMSRTHPLYPRLRKMKCDYEEMNDEMNFLLGRFERGRNPAGAVYPHPTADTAPIPLLPQPTWTEITSCPFVLHSFGMRQRVAYFRLEPLDFEKKSYILLNISHVKYSYYQSVSKS